MVRDQPDSRLGQAGVAHVLVGDLSEPTLAEEDQHHLGVVRRLRVGDRITVGDGRGSWRLAVVSAPHATKKRRGLVIEFISEIFHEIELEPKIVIGFVVPSMDRAAWAIQKMTEIGVDEVHLLRSRHSSTRMEGFSSTGREYLKLQKVIREAAMQSRAPYLPKLFPIIDLPDFLATFPNSSICTPSGQNFLGLDSPVVIGPEGGFAVEEVLSFAKTITLGRQILRSETAAVVAVGTLSLLRDGLIVKCKES